MAESQTLALPVQVTKMSVSCNDEHQCLRLSGVDAALIWRHYFVAIHASLHRADGIYFRYAYDHPFLTQTLAEPLPTSP